ncbi:hypothetical protein [Gorillibacterium sp. sgz5001074]|uniref:prenylated flavin chaperone LpdD n=1 Tax=Gorillibacterium sp. sgz5001074 TaxID=3446695 RepID=UPI003F681C57
MVSNNPYRLEVRTIPQGHDYVWLVTGGEAHVGAVAVAYWHNDELISHVHGVPGHREAELALELAELAAGRLKATVTVAAGIHIDRATKEEIVHLVQEVRRLAREELEILAEQRFSSKKR